jgi:hypothetical protein
VKVFVHARRALPGLLLAAIVLATAGAFAEPDGLTLEVGGGAAFVRTPAPYSTGAAQVGSAPTLWFGGRYGLSHQLELTLTAFYEITEPFYVSGTTVMTDAGNSTGTLAMRAKRFGALVGGRLLHGNVWRLAAGGELGWSQHSYASVALFDNGSPPRDYGLGLADTSKPSFVLAPSAGVVWVGDKLSVSLVPRFELLLGSRATWALSVPLTIGWDFYLF